MRTELYAVRVLTVVIASLYLAACGGGGSKASGGGGSKASGAFSSGLAPALKLAEINSTDYSTLCHSLGEWVRSHSTLTETCTLGGIIFGGFVDSEGDAVAGCSSLVSHCSESVSNNGPIDDASACIVNTSDKLANCAATVEELDGCLNDYLEQVDGLLSTLSCSIAGDEAQVQQALYTFGSPPPSERCLALEANCPQLFKKAEVAQS